MSDGEQFTRMDLLREEGVPVVVDPRQKMLMVAVLKDISELKSNPKWEKLFRVRPRRSKRLTEPKIPKNAPRKRPRKPGKRKKKKKRRKRRRLASMDGMRMLEMEADAGDEEDEDDDDEDEGINREDDPEYIAEKAAQDPSRAADGKWRTCRFSAPCAAGNLR